MALPIFAAAGALLGIIYAALPESAKEIGREEFERITTGQGDEYINAVIESAFENVGIDIDVEEGLNAQTLTAALNNGPLAGTGLEFSNIFDKDF